MVKGEELQVLTMRMKALNTGKEETTLMGKEQEDVNKSKDVFD